MGARAFHDPGRITGFRVFGWQFDWRPDGWLPLSIRRGRNPGWLVIPFGKGNVTVGRLAKTPAERVASRMDGYTQDEHAAGIERARRDAGLRRDERRSRAEQAQQRLARDA